MRRFRFQTSVVSTTPLSLIQTSRYFEDFHGVRVFPNRMFVEYQQRRILSQYIFAHKKGVL